MVLKIKIGGLRLSGHYSSGDFLQKKQNKSIAVYYSKKLRCLLLSVVLENSPSGSAHKSSMSDR